MTATLIALIAYASGFATALMIGVLINASRAQGGWQPQPGPNGRAGRSGPPPSGGSAARRSPKE